MLRSTREINMIQNSSRNSSCRLKHQIQVWIGERKEEIVFLEKCLFGATWFSIRVKGTVLAYLHKNSAFGSGIEEPIYASQMRPKGIRNKPNDL